MYDVKLHNHMFFEIMFNPRAIKGSEIAVAESIITSTAVH